MSTKMALARLLLVILPLLLSGKSVMSMAMTTALPSALGQVDKSEEEMCAEHCTKIEMVKSTMKTLEVPENILEALREYMTMKSCTTHSGRPGYLCSLSTNLETVTPNPTRNPPASPFCHVTGKCLGSTGLIVGYWPARSEPECQRACRAHEGCRYYTYFASERQCQGYTECNRIEETVNTATGVILCSDCVSGEASCGAAAGATLDDDTSYDNDIPDGLEEEVLSWAALQGNVSVVLYLTDKDGVDLDTTRGIGKKLQRAPIFLAAMRGHLDVVIALLEAGADGDHADDAGLTPLMVAVMGEHLEVAAYLVENGVDVMMALKKDGRTALHFAAQKGSLSLLRAMLSSNSSSVDVNVVTKTNRTLLYYAAQYGHAEMVEYLHSQGVQVDQPDNRGRTPLWMAAYNNAVLTVRTLLNLGADPSHPMDDSARPLHAAAYTGAAGAIRVLVEEAGVDVNQPRELDGLTALHLAAQKGREEAVELLLSLGADKGAKDMNGDTARDKATANAHFSIASILA